MQFICPGCKCFHGVPVKPNPKGWDFNGDFEKPTLSPSILIDYEGNPTADRPNRCHSHVRAGQIEFCSDSSHGFAGMTLPLPSLDSGGELDL